MLAYLQVAGGGCRSYLEVRSYLSSKTAIWSDSALSPWTKRLARTPGERRRDVRSVRAGGVQRVDR